MRGKRPQIKLDTFVQRASADELAQWDELADLQARIRRLEQHGHGPGRTPAEAAVVDRKLVELRAKLARLQEDA